MNKTLIPFILLFFLICTSHKGFSQDNSGTRNQLNSTPSKGSVLIYTPLNKFQTGAVTVTWHLQGVQSAEAGALYLQKIKSSNLIAGASGELQENTYAITFTVHPNVSEKQLMQAFYNAGVHYRRAENTEEILPTN
jgi:hypothetical protein